MFVTFYSSLLKIPIQLNNLYSNKWNSVENFPINSNNIDIVGYCDIFIKLQSKNALYSQK